MIIYTAFLSVTTVVSASMAIWLWYDWRRQHLARRDAERISLMMESDLRTKETYLKRTLFQLENRNKEAEDMRAANEAHQRQVESLQKVAQADQRVLRGVQKENVELKILLRAIHRGIREKLEIETESA